MLSQLKFGVRSSSKSFVNVYFRCYRCPVLCTDSMHTCYLNTTKKEESHCSSATQTIQEMNCPFAENAEAKTATSGIDEPLVESDHVTGSHKFCEPTTLLSFPLIFKKCLLNSKPSPYKENTDQSMQLETHTLAAVSIETQLDPLDQKPFFHVGRERIPAPYSSNNFILQ